MSNLSANASPIRRFFWPIFGNEHYKFLPMTFMISMILFNYTVLRNMKDTLVVSATGGSSIIPALKFFVVLPMALVAFLVITKLFNMFSKEKVFYIIISFFLGFFALFAFVLYPLQAYIHPTGFANYLHTALPDSTFFTNVINILQFWSFTLFYTFAELWGSIVASLLFWQFANDIVKVDEAKRFYGHFYLLANLATAFAGYLGGVFSKVGKSMPLETEVARFGVTVNITIVAMIIGSILIMLTYRYMNKKVLTDPNLVNMVEVKPKKKKPKLSVGQSIKFIFNSPYLGLIAMLVLCYGISINLVEVAWKNEIREYFALVQPHDIKSGYNAFMGKVSMINGLMTFIVILIGGYLVRLVGWRFGALATPVIIGITGSLFFYFMIFDHAAAPIASYFGTSVIFLTVLFGTIQNVMSKSTKYALFDPTKEMAYIPLDEESKSKGKAAVDVVGGRLGKAGGAAIQQFLFLFTTAGVAGIADILSVIVIAFVGLWIFSVFALYKRFVEKGGEQAKQKAKPKPVAKEKVAKENSPKDKQAPVLGDLELQPQS